jgi:hypothetical protein
MQLSIDFNYNNFFAVPNIEILVDNVCLHQGAVAESFDFNVELDDGEHLLSIRHYGKEMNWTTDKNDHHVFIKKVCFDKIDLDQIDYCKLTHRGKFYPDYEPSYAISCQETELVLPKFICPNHYLGHNGTWSLNFRSPGMLWIIQEQNPSGMHLEDTIFSTSDHVLQEVKDFFQLNV